MYHPKRYSEEELRKDQRLCKVLMSAVTAVIVIGFVIEMARMTP